LLMLKRWGLILTEESTESLVPVFHVI